MNASRNTGYRVRRATTEDLGRLIALWRLMSYPAEELSRRVTEFQIIEDGSGDLVGAAGIEIAERQGRLHNEGFADFSVSDQTRPLLWDRIQMLATNYGLLNVWTQEQAPFWRHSGFVEPVPEVLQKLPKPWSDLKGRWLVLKLREDIDAVLAADKEFTAFMQSEKARTQRALRHARALKLLATFIAAGIFVLVIVAGWYLLRNHPSFRH